jgi:hypothetical protein
MSLVLKKGGHATWREAALAQGARYGLESDVAEAFDKYIAAGDSETAAAWAACYDWDVLDLTDDLK